MTLTRVGAVLWRAAAVAALGAGLLGGAVRAAAQDASPHAIEIPKWFEDTFLVFPEDVRDAARAGKRVMIYFGQDGCPYCTRLMKENFTQRSIVEKTRKHFVAIAINVWGDREVQWTDGKTRSEKAFAAHLKIQFTPTILFLDEKGGVAARLNGYYPPHRFDAALDYAAQRLERKQDFASYMKTAPKEAASASLNPQPFFMKPPYDLRRKAGGKPLAVFFETPYCSGCDEMHKEALNRPEIRKLLARFDLARFDLSDRAAIVAADGAKTTPETWARALKVGYTPTIVMFDDRGREAFRVEAYVRPFHLGSAFDYVASGAWRTQPSFQRHIQALAERRRDKGERVDLWE